MELFELDKNGKLELAPQAILIKEFKVLWERDKSKNKKIASFELGFVYYMMHWRSPYSKYSLEGDERKEKIIEDVFSNEKWRPDEKVMVACDKYEELSSSVLMLLLKDAQISIETLRKYFREVDLAEEDEKGKLKYTAKDLIANLKALGDVVVGVKKLEAEVAKELVEGSSIKGGGQAGAFEDV